MNRLGRLRDRRKFGSVKVGAVVQHFNGIAGAHLGIAERAEQAKKLGRVDCNPPRVNAIPQPRFKQDQHKQEHNRRNGEDRQKFEEPESHCESRLQTLSQPYHRHRMNVKK
jgi:hypothetical protein